MLRFPRSLSLILIGMIAIFGCQRSRVPPLHPPIEATNEERLSRLRTLEGSLKGIQGVADLEISSPAGVYRGKEIFSIELPDRLRFESLNFLGFPDWVLSSDGEKIELYVPSERKIIRGESNPENLQRMLGAKIPISCMLRILMGEPPFPLTDGSATWILLGDAGEFFQEGGKASFPLQQRLWVNGGDGTLSRGEIFDEGGIRLSFQCRDYREINGFLVPFILKIHLERARVRLELTHREVRTNPSFHADSFSLALPLPNDVHVLNIEEMEAVEDWQR